MSDRKVISLIFIVIGLALGAYTRTDMWQGGIWATMGMIFLAIIIIQQAAEYGGWTKEDGEGEDGEGEDGEGEDGEKESK